MRAEGDVHDGPRLVRVRARVRVRVRVRGRGRSRVRGRVRVVHEDRRVDPLDGLVVGAATGRVQHRPYAVLARRVLREAGRQQGL